jgi:UDP-N-acetylglucosamine 3-dehydrogenase
MAKLAVAVLGLGGWGKNHVRVLKELEKDGLVKLLAVADVDKVHAYQIGKTYDIDWYTDVTKVLERPDIEAVTICTPTGTHLEIALQSLEYEKDILVEKPMVTSAIDAKKLIEKAAAKNQRIMPGFIERFNSGVSAVKEAINQNKIGAVVSAFAQRVSRWPERSGEAGVIFELAIHDIDVIRYLLGEDPISVYARAGRKMHTKYDYADILMEFRDERSALIKANWVTPQKIRTLEVTGTEAILRLEYLTQEVTLYRATEMIEPEAIPTSTRILSTVIPRGMKREILHSVEAWEEPLKLELRHFAEALLQDAPFKVSSLDGLRAIEIAEAATSSIKSNTQIKLV